MITLASPKRFSQIELAGISFVVPANDPAGRAGGRGHSQAVGLDLESAIAAKAPNVLVGSASAMIEQLQERREAFGVSYVVVGTQDAEAFGPVVQRLAGT